MEQTVGNKETIVASVCQTKNEKNEEKVFRFERTVLRKGIVGWGILLPKEADFPFNEGLILLL